MLERHDSSIIYPQTTGNLRILKYHDSMNCDVIFDTGTKLYGIPFYYLTNGNVKDPMYPSIHGVGYLGVGPFKTTENRKSTKLYNLFQSMLLRCYSGKFPAYVGCSVVKRWHNFQNFCEDIIQMSNWNNEGFHLDKDLRVLGNKKYGPKYCSFVPVEINTSFESGEFKGCSLNRGRYVAHSSFSNKKKYLGSFDTEKQAHAAYLNARKIHLSKLAKRFRNSIHPDVYKNLTKE